VASCKKETGWKVLLKFRQSRDFKEERGWLAMDCDSFHPSRFPKCNNQGRSHSRLKIHRSCLLRFPLNQGHYRVFQIYPSVRRIVSVKHKAMFLVDIFKMNKRFVTYRTLAVEILLLRVFKKGRCIEKEY